MSGEKGGNCDGKRLYFCIDFGKIGHIVQRRCPMLKYQCLILDHDDTVVRSTPTVNYTAVQQAMAKLRPQVNFTLEQFAMWNFEPGFQALMRDIWKLDPEEQTWLYDQWLQYAMSHMPPLYDGIEEILRRFRAEGGKISVVSHSCKDNILRDYQNLLGFLPDLVFGWEMPEEQRKPQPYPVLETLRQLGLSREQALVVDDLRPGCDMANACGVDFAGAGWSHDQPEIAAYLRAHGTVYCRTVRELEEFLFG
jgi:beta-phosphoglucomutase-like phosphatase (HAD superfamily)